MSMTNTMFFPGWDDFTVDFESPSDNTYVHQLNDLQIAFIRCYKSTQMQSLPVPVEQSVFCLGLSQFLSTQ